MYFLTCVHNVRGNNNTILFETAKADTECEWRDVTPSFSRGEIFIGLGLVLGYLYNF